MMSIRMNGAAETQPMTFIGPRFAASGDIVMSNTGLSDVT